MLGLAAVVWPMAEFGGSRKAPVIWYVCGHHNNFLCRGVPCRELICPESHHEKMEHHPMQVNRQIVGHHGILVERDLLRYLGAVHLCYLVVHMLESGLDLEGVRLVFDLGCYMVPEPTALDQVRPESEAVLCHLDLVGKCGLSHERDLDCHLSNLDLCRRGLDLCNHLGIHSLLCLHDSPNRNSMRVDQSEHQSVFWDLWASRVVGNLEVALYPWAL